MKRSPTLALLLASLATLGVTGCGHPFVAATPQGFVDLGERYPHGEYRATTADGVIIGIRAYDNDPQGELSFWSRALERRMRETGGYALLDKHPVSARGGLTGIQMRFGHDEGKEPYLYEIVLFVTEKKIYLLEAGGTKTEMAKQDAQIEWAIKSFAPK
jgi:hypothetical protein